MLDDKGDFPCILLYDYKLVETLPLRLRKCLLLQELFSFVEIWGHRTGDTFFISAIRNLKLQLSICGYGISDLQVVLILFYRFFGSVSPFGRAVFYKVLIRLIVDQFPQHRLAAGGVCYIFDNPFANEF